MMRARQFDDFADVTERILHIKLSILSLQFLYLLLSIIFTDLTQNLSFSFFILFVLTDILNTHVVGSTAVSQKSWFTMEKCVSCYKVYEKQKYEYDRDDCWYYDWMTLS